MTTEDDFQTQLDAHPGDWQTRLVFADWLEERGDPRADGYRALGVLKRVPIKAWWFQYASALVNKVSPDTHVLPMDWYFLLPQGVAQGWPEIRREAEDITALAFAKLPAARRAELLAATLTA